MPLRRPLRAAADRRRMALVLAAAIVTGAVVVSTALASPARPAGAATATAAPEAEALTLAQALRRVSAGNVDLQRERINIGTSRANVLAAEGQFDFVLSGDATYSHLVTPRLSSAGELAASSSNNLSFDAKLARALESGGQLALATQGGWSHTNSGFQCGLLTASCDIYDGTVQLTFTQPLLRGFGAEIALANLRKQHIQHDVALLNRQARAANIVRDAVGAYWELAYQTQELAIRRSAVELANDQLRLTRAQIAVGKLGTLALAAVQRAIADREQAVAASERELALRALDLQRLFGTPTTLPFQGYRAEEVPRATGHELDVVAEARAALDGSPALKALRMGRTLSEIDRRVAAESLRPQLDLVGSMGTTGRNTDFGETGRQMLRAENAIWSAGLVFQLPVQNRAARGQAEAAVLGEDRARLEATDLELAIRDGVARFAARIRAAGRRIELARDAVGFAAENLDAERARFNVGQSTNNDILLRQQELKEAEIQVARATVDLLVGDTALQALTGEILDRYGIGLDGA